MSGKFVRFVTFLLSFSTAVLQLVAPSVYRIRRNEILMSGREFNGVWCNLKLRFEDLAVLYLQCTITDILWP